jgi:4'-phosphopantetheinyl transferase
MEHDSRSARSSILPPNEIHVWRANLAMLREKLSYRFDLLSPDEIARAASFHCEAPREEFQSTRVLLRLLLERYGAGEAGKIRFSYSATGKPAMVGGRIHFSVSHSEGLALLALAASGPIGIDLEKSRAVGEMDGIAERYFARQDREIYLAAPESERQAIFFRLWTHREAVLKAIGIGIPGLEEVIDESKWLVSDVKVEAGYFAAVAYEKTRKMEVVARQLMET